MQSGGGGWTQVPGRGARARAKVPPGGGAGGGAEAGGRGAGAAGGRGGTAGAGGQASNRPLPAGRGGLGRAFQPRSFLPRASLEVRENTACLHMEGFQVLPTEAEFVQWLEEEGRAGHHVPCAGRVPVSEY